MMEKNIRRKNILSILIAFAFVFTAFGFADSVSAAETHREIDEGLNSPAWLKATCKKNDNDVTLTWAKVSASRGYFIYRSTNDTRPVKPLKRITKVTTTKYVDKNIKVTAKNSTKFRYWVKAISKNKSEDGREMVPANSPKKMVTVKRYLTYDIKPMKFYTKTKSTIVPYKAATGSAKVKKAIPKGTKLVVVAKYPKKIKPFQHAKRVKVLLKKNGKVVYSGWLIPYKQTTGMAHNVSYVKKFKKGYDWTKADKEKWINKKKKFRSGTKYLIWVSQHTQRVNFFKGRKGHFKLYKTVRCTTGRFLHQTKNTFKGRIKNHLYRRDKDTPEYGKYFYTHLTFFGGNGSFHTECYKTDNPKKKVACVWASHKPTTKGCVRLKKKNAKYVYGLPNGTRVIVY